MRNQSIKLPIIDVIKQNFNDVSEEYKKFAIEKDKCRKCSIYNHSCSVVQNEGCTKNPIFMFVGDSPGLDEVLYQRPFIGNSGQILRNELRKYSIFNKTTTILSNIIPCRPKNNKFPTDDSDEHLIEDNSITDFNNKQSVLGKINFNELAKALKFDINSYYLYSYITKKCFDTWLKKEIKFLKPKCIITLGGASLYFLLQKKSVTKIRGAWIYSKEFNSILFPTFHPSYILRCKNDFEKRHVVQEFNNDIEKIAKSWSAIYYGLKEENVIV